MDGLASRVQYLEAGYDPLPLKPNSKLPLVSRWQEVATFRQWQRATDEANIGLRAGGGHAFIDCDEPQTFESVTAWLDGLGHKRETLTVVRSASGTGRHIYCNFAGNALGSWRTLKIGKGEFRYGPGSYVAAPPSRVETGTYELLQGDYTTPTVLDMTDVAALVDLVGSEDGNKAPSMSALARSIADGYAPDRYKGDHSAEEQALILSMVNSGFDFEAIRTVFITRKCAGHYRKVLTQQGQAAADRWLYHSCGRALERAAMDSAERQTIRHIRELAEADRWDRVSDRVTFLAHCDLAYRTGRTEYAASVRDLAVSAGIGTPTVQSANKRLVARKLVGVKEPAVGVLATRYTLCTDGQPYTLPKNPPCEGVYKVSQGETAAEAGVVVDLRALEQSDAFRNGKNRLGRRAGQIYRLLFGKALTSEQIAARVGIRDVRHVLRLLERLASVTDPKTEKVVPLVARDEAGRWTSQVVDVELLETFYNLRGARNRQRRAYEKERRAHARSLELGALRKGG